MIDASRLFAVVPSFLIHNRNSLYKNTVTKIIIPLKDQFPARNNVDSVGRRKVSWKRFFSALVKQKFGRNDKSMLFSIQDVLYTQQCKNVKV